MRAVCCSEAVKTLEWQVLTHLRLPPISSIMSLMGTFRYPVKLHGADAGVSRTREMQALVDTGATYSWIPTDILADLGYHPSFRRRLRLANGTVIEKEGGVVQVEIDGAVLPTIAIYGDVGSEPLLGAVTMEEFSLAPDPLGQRLVPVVALLMTFFDPR